MAMVEKEQFLRLAGDDGSSLTRSFWFGKFLQQLPEDELSKLGLSGSRSVSGLIQALRQSSSSNSACSDSSSLSKDGERREIKLTSSVGSFDVEEVMKCLTDSKTSLSPNVYDIVVNSTHSLPPTLLSSILQSSFLRKDCTLDWDTVALHLEECKGTSHLNNHYTCHMILYSFV